MRVRRVGRWSLVDLPPAPGWSLVIGADVLRLVDPAGDAAYEQERDPDLEPWIAVAVAEGSCLAMTGSELGLADALVEGNYAAIAAAVQGERLVGGVVRVVVE